MEKLALVVQVDALPEEKAFYVTDALCLGIYQTFVSPSAVEAWRSVTHVEGELLLNPS